MELILIWFVIMLVVTIFNNAVKGAKTGSYKQANTASSIRKKGKERCEIDARYDPTTKYLDPNYQREMAAHREKWAYPGTKAYKEIEEKKAKWDAGERW